MSELWEEKKEVKPKRTRSKSYSKNKGSAYEHQIVKELRELTGNDNIAKAGKALDNMKIDIFDQDEILPCYFQLKKTKVTPSIKKINEAVGKKDKPLCILWNVQIQKEGNVNITSGGEYAMIPKTLFYDLIKNYITGERPESEYAELSKEGKIVAKTIEYYNKLKEE